MAASTTADKPGETAALSGILASSSSAEVNPSGTELEETHYLTGIKLFLTMSGITVMTLLVMLDTSIMGTVSLARGRTASDRI